MGQRLMSNQINFFDLCSFENLSTIDDNQSFNVDTLSTINYLKFNQYSLEEYKKDILSEGLKVTWDKICFYVLNSDVKNEILSLQNLAELYEIGLEILDKQTKKVLGQYYTPDDVALVMANWLKIQKGKNVCDVACGTGKLILAYLDILGEDNAINLIKNGNLYLYDIDEIALNICVTIILLKYGKEMKPFINVISGDFLSNKISLPNNCKVISNPPYATIDVLKEEWEKTDVALNTKELYSMFMGKIINQSESSVIITPYSFIGGNKFYSLRKMMNDYNGFIVSFDNVPGNIFRGKKHGVFNTNTSNSVRAAITIVENVVNKNGFRTTPLIRFKNEERKKLLQTDVLESFISNEYQIVSKEKPMYYKCSKELNDIWELWQEKSTKNLGDYISQNGQNIISVPKTCRYFTTASNGLMKRNGQIILNIEDKDVFYYVYCLINSSFAYWYWRLYDGGITYPRGLMLNMPVFYDKLTKEDKDFFKDIATEMINNSNKYIVTKNNIGIQENIKFPVEYRDKINVKILEILGCKNITPSIFDDIHRN